MFGLASKKDLAQLQRRIKEFTAEIEEEKRAVSRSSQTVQVRLTDGSSVTTEDIVSRIAARIELTIGQRIDQAVKRLDLNDLAEKLKGEIDIEAVQESLASLLLDKLIGEIDKEELVRQVAGGILDDYEDWFDFDELREQVAGTVAGRITIAVDSGE